MLGTTFTTLFTLVMGEGEAPMEEKGRADAGKG